VPNVRRPIETRPTSKTLFNFITIILLSINTIGPLALYEIIIIFYFLSPNLMFVISWRNLALRYSLWVTWLGGLSLGSAALRLLTVESDRVPHRAVAKFQKNATLSSATMMTVEARIFCGGIRSIGCRTIRNSANARSSSYAMQGKEDLAPGSRSPGALSTQNNSKSHTHFVVCHFSNYLA